VVVARIVTLLLCRKSVTVITAKLQTRRNMTMKGIVPRLRALRACGIALFRSGASDPEPGDPAATAAGASCPPLPWKATGRRESRPSMPIVLVTCQIP